MKAKSAPKNTSLTFVGDSFKNTGNINSTGQTTIQSLKQDGSANTGEIYNLGNITGRKYQSADQRHAGAKQQWSY
ncbi:filamentous hemagglutinin family protein [Klebsiella pneumoniae subsp. rhinoscleromatis]|nr:filamentous hemagglutinin family protein [Klebsiella pneumoniae subsp. rhinoscleromatis]